MEAPSGKKYSNALLASKENGKKLASNDNSDLKNRAKKMFTGLDDEDMNTFAAPTSEKASE